MKMTTDAAQPADERAAITEFFDAYARAMLTWQGVEAALFHVFRNLLGAEVELAGAVYYSLDSFRPKLRAVDALAKVSWRGEQLTAWNRVHAKVNTASTLRNVLAHHSAAGDLTGFALAPPVFVPLPIRRKRERLDAKRLDRLCVDFVELARDLDFLVFKP